MKRRLIIANTYYQLIVALQLRFTLFKNDVVVLLLSDHSNGSEQISERISDEHYFTEVKYIKTKFLRKKKSKIAKLLNVYENIITKNNRYKKILDGIERKYSFDEIITFNVDIFVYNLYSILYSKNNNLIVSGYEEGALSYNSQKLSFYGSNIICRFRRFFGQKGMDEAFRFFYCFYPSLYNGMLKSVEIPSITYKGRLQEALQRIFDIIPTKLYYPQKYIYFTSVYDFEGGYPIGEFELVNKISEIIGRDNLLVKVHPRDDRNVFLQSGLSIDKNSTIPWEAIQLSADFSDKVYLTATSGSVLAGSFLSPKPIRTYYLFRMCDICNNVAATNSVNTIEKLLSYVGEGVDLTNIKIVQSIEEI